MNGIKFFKAMLPVLLVVLLMMMGAGQALAQFPSTSLSIGTLPAGKSVTVTFEVTVNSPFPSGPTQVCNQGTVSGSNFSSVLTDDPAVGGSDDPTCTLVTKPDIGVTAINTPGTDCGLTSAEAVTITISNFTAITLTGFNVRFQVTGPINTGPVTETFNGTLPSLGTATFTFSGTANLSTAGTYTVTATTLLTDDANTGNDAASTNVDNQGACFKPFVFLANKVTLSLTKQHTPAGDIHSNGTLTVNKGDPSTYNSNLTAKGKITIGSQNTINGNVRSQTSISNSGTINGTKTIGPVNTEPLPSLSYSAGGQNKTVPQNGTLSLSPNSYNNVILNSFSTLKLTSGDYYFTSLKYNSSTTTTAVIEINLSSGNPVTINVVSNLYLGNEVEIRLLPNGETDSPLVIFNTMQSTAVTLGREAYLLGAYNAPNAKVTLAKNSQLRGSICANEILTERDCLFLHFTSPGSLPGPGNLPKSLEDEEEVISDQSPVTSYELAQNYPNPFSLIPRFAGNPSTSISFALLEAGEVSLVIYNTKGQVVRALVAGEMNAGRHNVIWDATDARGQRVSSGVYLYVLKAGEFTAQRKLVLMK